MNETAKTIPDDYLWRVYVDKCLEEAQAEIDSGAPMIPADEILRRMDARIANAQASVISK